MTEVAMDTENENETRKESGNRVAHLLQRT